MNNNKDDFFFFIKQWRRRVKDKNKYTYYTANTIYTIRYYNIRIW